jgi:hypothetical protein
MQHDWPDSNARCSDVSEDRWLIAHRHLRPLSQGGPNRGRLPGQFLTKTYALMAGRANMKICGLGRRACSGTVSKRAVSGVSSRSKCKTGLSALNPMAVAANRVPSDTGPAVEAFLIEGYRRMAPAQKLERVRTLTRAVQSLAIADIRRRHPEASEREQSLRLASRWIEPELMLRAFGWDVRKNGY